MALTAVILAAGEGRRMQSDRPKALADLAGRPLIEHVLARARALDPRCIRVVVGHGAESVRAALPDDVETVVQPTQRGTGDATRCALHELPPDDVVLVLCGDVPLVEPDTLRALVAAAGEADCALITVEVDRPHGYGRIVRDAAGEVARIVEERDASADEQAIREINTGILAMPAATLSAHVETLDNDNAQREYYLTDVVGRVRADGGRVAAVQPTHGWEVAGVNDRHQLAALERAWQRHLAGQLMDAGVTLRDPARIDIRGTLTVERDVVIDVDCVFEGEVHIESAAEIGPGCTISDSRIGPGTRLASHCVLEGVRTGSGCAIGPFARLRPGTTLDAAAAVGNFVEIKNATVGEGSKINHLSYVGDATIGTDANIGAGVITCNYDGHSKHRTEIGDRAFIGSDSQLIAPVRVGNDATIGAGSTIIQDAPAGELTVSRSRQRTVPGWKRPGERDGEAG